MLDRRTEHGRALSNSFGYSSVNDFTDSTAKAEDLFTRISAPADERMYADKKKYYEQSGMDRRCR